MAGFLGRLARFIRAEMPNLGLSSSGGSPYKTTGWGPRSARWRPGKFGPNAALDYTADILRDQSRDLVRKNALAASAIDRIVSNVVGTGIKPKITDDAIASLWLRWTDEADAGGMLDFYGLQTQVMRSVVEGGECFIRLRPRYPQDGLSVPFQLEILEPEFVPLDWNRTTEGGGIIRQGIEFDRNVRSRRVAYWVYPRHPGEMQIDADAAQWEPVRIPASEIIHVFDPRRPGQIRGEPWLARVLARIADVEGYDEAELQRKRTSALFVGFVRRPSPEGGFSLEEMQEIWGDGAQAGADGVGEVSLEPSTMQTLLPGEDVEFAQPSDVGGQYETFMRAQHRSIAAAMGILYEQLVGDYSQVNDRTWRAAMMEFRRRCGMWQHQIMVYQFCRPVWRRWVDLAVLGGAIDASSAPDEAPTWTPPRWDYINPVQDIQAMRESVQAGFTSRSALVSELGEDAVKVDAEIAADNARADELGLRLTTDGRVTNPETVLPNEVDGTPADNPGDPGAQPQNVLRLRR
ncbi:phage portal protein [Alsobacter sp. R-9]